MKNIFLVFSLFIFSAKAQNVTLHLKGTIKNNTAKDVLIKTSTDEVLTKLPVNNDKVDGKLELSQGFYKMMIGQEYTDIYVSNGDLNFTIDLKEFDETINYTGSLANENNYLALKLLNSESFKGEKKMFFDREEKMFLDSLNHIYSQLDKLLENSSLSENFRKQQLSQNRIERWNTMMMYASYHPYLTKKENFKLPVSYYQFLTQINVNDKEQVANSEYIALVNEYFNYWQKKRMTQDQSEDSDMAALGKLELMQRKITVVEIRDAIVKMEYGYRLTKSSRSDELKTAYIQTAGSDELKKEIEDHATKLAKLKDGNPAPSFKLINDKGQEKSLSDYRGKYVYLDVWATWCGPCKKELPHYEEVKKLYKGKNIEFVSICVWDKKEAWENFLKAKSLGGEQLFNEQSDKEFTDNYMIQGVPTFVLIDKEGKLISRDAERPSDEALKTRIDALLTK